MKENEIRAKEILEYVFTGMRSPEEKTQIAGALYYLEKALSEQYVYIICYHDLEDGNIDFGVTFDKQSALQLLAERLKEIREGAIPCDRIQEEYSEEGDMSYFALEKDEVTIYECFLRKEKIL